MDHVNSYSNGQPLYNGQNPIPNSPNQSGGTYVHNQKLHETVNAIRGLHTRGCEVATKNLELTKISAKKTRTILNVIGVIVAVLAVALLVFALVGGLALSFSPFVVVIVGIVAVIALPRTSIAFFEYTYILESIENHKQACITYNMATINSLSEIMHLMFQAPESSDASTVLSGEQNKVLNSNMQELLDPRNNKNKVFTNFTKLADCYHALLTKARAHTLVGEDTPILEEKSKLFFSSIFSILMKDLPDERSDVFVNIVKTLTNTTLDNIETIDAILTTKKSGDNNMLGEATDCSKRMITDAIKQGANNGFTPLRFEDTSL